MTTWLHPHGAMITPNEDGHHFCPSPVFRWGIRNPPSTRYLELGGWKKVRQSPLNMKGTKNPHRLLAKTNSNILIRLQLFSDAYLNISKGKSPPKKTKWPGTFFSIFLLEIPLPCLQKNTFATQFAHGHGKQRHGENDKYGESVDAKATTCERKLLFPTFLCFLVGGKHK